MSIFDYSALDRLASEKAATFKNAKPCPHLVIDDFVAPEVLDKVLAEIGEADESWTHWKHYNQKKEGLKDMSRMGPNSRALFQEMNSPKFVAFVEKLTGLGPLVSDDSLDGGGIHITHAGGHLNIHTDFQAHTINKNWSREINFLVYLNKDWKREYGGSLEFWDPETMTKAVEIVPNFGRAALFHTSERSLHGHPDPLACPPDRARQSIALWYYTVADQPLDVQPTEYFARPTDSLKKKILVQIDNWLVRIYSLLKRYTPLNDQTVSRVLKYFR